MTLRGVGGPRLNVIMRLIFKNSLEVSPKSMLLRTTENNLFQHSVSRFLNSHCITINVQLMKAINFCCLHASQRSFIKVHFSWGTACTSCHEFESGLGVGQITRAIWSSSAVELREVNNSTVAAILRIK